MSVVFSGTFSGTFVSNGQAKFIPLPSGVDWMTVQNETVSYAGGADHGAEFYWRLGMAQGRGTIYTKLAADDSLTVAQLAANTGFFLQDTTINIPGPSRVLTGITADNPPHVLTASTAGLITGTIVRIFSTVGAQQLGGMDFTINDVQANTRFSLAYMAPIVAANPGAGTYRVIPFNPYFYPSIRYISKIISDPNDVTRTIVTLTVDHTLKVGQKVRFKVPAVTAAQYGMTELNNLELTIVAVGVADADNITNTISVDIDSSGFTAFSFPLTAAPRFTPAFIEPIGENTGVAIAANGNILADAVTNTGVYGMLLMAGVNSPAGVDTNVISWVAGKSFNQ